MAGMMFLSQYVAKEFYDAFILLLMLGAAYEMSKAIGNKYSKPMFPLLAIFIFIGYTAFKFVHEFNAYANSGNGFGGITSYFVVMIAMIIVCFIVNMASAKHSFENVISTLICMKKCLIFIRLQSSEHLSGLHYMSFFRMRLKRLRRLLSVPLSF